MGWRGEDAHAAQPAKEGLGDERGQTLQQGATYSEGRQGGVEASADDDTKMAGGERMVGQP